MTTPAYQTLKSYDDFEVRLYPAATLASAVAPQFFPQIRQGFRPLHRYINGHNRTSQVMPMTTPVLIAPAGTAENVYLMQFYLPSAWTVDTAPLPNGDDVALLAAPSTKVAVLRYSGMWSQDAFASHALKLQQALAAADLQAVGAPTMARYNSPYTPFFMRRNEVWLQVA